MTTPEPAQPRHTADPPAVDPDIEAAFASLHSHIDMLYAAVAEQRERADKAEAALAALHEGEEPPGTTPLPLVSPAQWIWLWNRHTPAERLDLTGGVFAASREAAACFEENHRKRIEQAEDLLRIANDTSNTSEAERARAVQRADTAEAERDAARAELADVHAELAALNGETAGLNPYAMAGRRDAVARIRTALARHQTQETP